MAEDKIPCVPGRVHRWEEIPGFGWFATSYVMRCDCGLIRILEHHGAAPMGGRLIYARIEEAR